MVGDDTIGHQTNWVKYFFNNLKNTVQNKIPTGLKINVGQNRIHEQIITVKVHLSNNIRNQGTSEAQSVCHEFSIKLIKFMGARKLYLADKF